MTETIGEFGAERSGGNCMDARGISDVELMSGAQRSTRDELARRTTDPDMVLVL